MPVASTQVNDLIRTQIPSWNQLFHNDSQCACDECESMTGAPAYLAHILHFAEQCKPNSNNKTPYDILIQRAPYLPYLPLTCANTNTEMSYVNVVLEILEFFATKGTLTDMPAYDSGSTDWVVKYESTSKEAYKLLSTQCYPFTLPYHQPLDVIRTFLTKSKTDLTTLLELFNTQNNINEQRLFNESLGLSDEEYSLLTEFKIGNNAVDVFKLYGYNDLPAFQAALFGPNGVRDFLTATGLQYTELIDLLKTQYINPEIQVVHFIQRLFTGSVISGKDLFVALKDIRNTAANDAGLNAKIQAILDKSNKKTLDTATFKKFLDDHFDLFQQTIIINPDEDDPCNFTIARLSTILSSNDPAIVTAVSDDQFKKLYFFIRLLRKTGWTIAELDTILAPLSNSTNKSILATLSFFNRFNQKTEIGTSHFIALSATSDPLQPQSIYAQLFLNNLSKLAANDFAADEFGEFFSKPVMLRNGGKYNQVLLSALGISAGEMDLLVTHNAISNPDAFQLSVGTITVLYSYVILSGLLRVSISDLLGLTQALGKKDVLRTWDPVNSKFTEASLASTAQLMDFTTEISEAGFSSREVLYTIGLNEKDPAYQFSPDKIKAVLLELRQEFILAVQQNPELNDENFNEDALRNKLLILYDKDIVSQLLGMFDNKIVYGLTLPLKPDLNIPDQLKAKLYYDKGTGRLEVTGVLNASDKVLIAADNEMDTAVKPIWDKPADFMKQHFSAFLDDNARQNLLDRTNNQTTTPAEKQKKFYTAFQPFLVKQLKLQAIVQKIAGFISFDQTTTGLITKSVIEDLYNIVKNNFDQYSSATNDFPEPGLNDFTNHLIAFNKAALFISKFELTPVEVDYFLANAADFSAIDFRKLNLEQWRQMNRYRIVRKLNQSREFSWIDLFVQASAGASIDALGNFISILTKWSKDEIIAVVSNSNINAAAFKNADGVFNISRLFTFAGKTPFKPSMLAKWAQADTQFDTFYNLAAEVKNQVLLQYVPAERSDAESKISNDLLQRQRNALVDYILTLKQVKENQITNIEELCGYFLIDLPMSACMPTTRIRQAISTVQSFFKRCLMGLESIIDKNTGKQVGVAPSQIDNSVWEPKSFFRTWQVTMEFLTHPYPYLSYKYLIEKSEPSKTLEATLLKSDITQRNVEDAYRTYLQDMAQMANLEIAAIYIDDTINVDGDTSTKFIHLIGKSRSAPGKYYYCTKNESGRWSFLQPMSISVKDNDGDGNGTGGAHLIFTKFRDRYFLLMPEFIKRQNSSDTTASSATPESLRTKAISQFPVEILYEIQLGICELFQGKWTKKTYLTIKGDWNIFKQLKQLSPDQYYFSIDKNSLEADALDIHLFADSFYMLTFSFFSPNASVMVSKKNIVSMTPPSSYQQFTAKTSWQLRVPNGDDDDFKEVFSKKNVDLFFTMSPQFGYYIDFMNFNFHQPFFIHDGNRTYYTTPEPFTHVESFLDVKPHLYQYPQKTLVDILKSPMTSVYLPLHV